MTDGTYRAELSITGLAVVDGQSHVVYFVDATKQKGPHRHYPCLTIRPENYAGEPIPEKGYKKFLRPAVNGDFSVSFPLRGPVRVGTSAELSGKLVPPALGTAQGAEASGCPDAYRPYTEIVTRSQLGYDRLTCGYESRAITSIQLCGGELFAAKRMLRESGDYQRFKVDGESRYFCEQLLWVRRGLNRALLVETRRREYRLRGLMHRGEEAVLQLSLTNLPRRGRLGREVHSEYFKHLKMLVPLGVAIGTFKAPVKEGGPISGGSESCSPVWGD